MFNFCKHYNEAVGGQRWVSEDKRYSIQRLEFRKPAGAGHPYHAEACTPYFKAYAVWDRSQGIGESGSLEQAIEVCAEFEKLSKAESFAKAIGYRGI